MLNSLLSIEDYSIFGLDIVHLSSFNEMVFRFTLNLLEVFIIVRMLYYPVTRRKDYLFSFVLISILVFFICFLLESVKLQVNTELQRALTEFEDQQQLLKFEKENYAMAKENLDISLARLRLGQTTALEVRQA